MAKQLHVITLHSGETAGELTPPQMAVVLNLEPADADTLANEISNQCNDKAGWEDAHWAIATPLSSLSQVVSTQNIIDMFTAGIEEND